MGEQNIPEQRANGNVENMVGVVEGNFTVNNYHNKKLDDDERKKLVGNICELKNTCPTIYWSIYNHCKAQHKATRFDSLDDDTLKNYSTMAESLHPVAVAHQNQMKDDQVRFSHRIIFRLYKIKRKSRSIRRLISKIIFRRE